MFYRFVSAWRLLACLVFCAAAPLARPTADDSLNVILIFVDDLGYDDLGSYGSTDALTPHLDSLAAQGLRFTDFYAGSPVCTPSRYALLTGRYPFRADNPALLNHLVWHDTENGIDDRDSTLAEAFQANGYQTALIGKWHLGHGSVLVSDTTDSQFHPLHHGFDSFYGSFMGIDYNTHWHGDEYLDWWENRRPAPEDSLGYATQLFGDRAVAYIDERPEAGAASPPFFLYLPFTAPHFGRPPVMTRTGVLQLPIGQEEEYLSRFDGVEISGSRMRTILRKRYLAMVAVLDDEVGRIMDALDRNGLADRTVIWFISDNGGFVELGASNAPLRGGKKEPYEGGIRVPSFVSWPGHIAPGVSAQLAGNIDVAPTLLSLAGIPFDHPVDGIDLGDHLAGGPVFSRGGIATVNAVHGDAYRLRQWKLVRPYDAAGAPLPPELYDLSTDANEVTDLASVYPDTLAMLVDLLPYGKSVGARPTAMDSPAKTAVQRAVRAPETELRVAPNPSRPGAGDAFVELTLGMEERVRLEVFDLLGRRIALLWEGPLEASTYRFALPATASGTFVVRAASPSGTHTVKATRAR
ncbi:MAG: sulfatase-like hydrolase/transferase [Bacteroidota bacterium]